jgi:hypothetical protein
MITIRSVKPLEGFQVLLEFSTGEKKTVDLEPLMQGPIFEPLRNDPELFRALRVDEELGTIVWPNGADLDPNVLYGSHAPAWMDKEPADTMQSGAA